MEIKGRKAMNFLYTIIQYKHGYKVRGLKYMESIWRLNRSKAMNLLSGIGAN